MRLAQLISFAFMEVVSQGFRMSNTASISTEAQAKFYRST